MKDLNKMVCGGVLTLNILACTAGSQGVIVNPIEPDPSFVMVTQELVVTLPVSGRLQERSLQGEEGEFVTPEGYSIQAASGDGRVLALGNSATDLFIHERDLGTAPFEIQEVRGRASGVAISPDGSTVAVSLHSDYDSPLKSGVEFTDDAIYLVDVASKKVRVIPASRKGWVMTLWWLSADELVMQWRAPGTGPADPWLLLNVKSGARVDAHQDSVLGMFGWRQAPSECEGETLGQDELGLFLGPREQPTYLIDVEGRKRGFHDHFPTITSYHFVKDCDHVVFTHDGKVYVHQRSSKKTALIGEGVETWFFPGK